MPKTAPAHAPVETPAGWQCQCGLAYDGSMACRKASLAAKVGKYAEDQYGSEDRPRRQTSFRAGMDGDSGSNLVIRHVRA